jgi:hypothetical protein
MNINAILHASNAFMCSIHAAFMRMHAACAACMRMHAAFSGGRIFLIRNLSIRFGCMRRF